MNSSGNLINRDDVPTPQQQQRQQNKTPRGGGEFSCWPRSPDGRTVSPAAAAAAAYPGPVDVVVDDDLDLPETRSRRLWELRLLHNQQTEMTQVFPTPQSDAVVRLWSHVMPELALRDGGALLHIMLASSALNLWHRSGGNDESGGGSESSGAASSCTCTSTSSSSSSSSSSSAAAAAERRQLMALQTHYLAMCFRAQRRDVAGLGSRNADYVCFTSLKIVSHSLALVQTLPADPWEPPLQWLHMGRGADEVFRRAAGLVNPADGDRIMTFLNSPPALSEANTTAYDRGPLAWLLEYPGGAGRGPAGARGGREGQGEGEEEDRELEEDAEAREAYEKAISYTCSVRGAIGRGEPVFSVVRRLAAFSVFVPTAFIRLLAERRPRAMVILAHFMALWLGYEDIWLIGKGGERQIRGIRASLPAAWHCKLDGLPRPIPSGRSGPAAAQLPPGVVRGQPAL